MTLLFRAANPRKSSIGLRTTVKSEGARDHIEPDRFSNVRNTLLVLFLPRVKFAPFLPTIGALGIEPDPGTDICDCLVEVSLGGKRQSAVMKGFGVSTGWTIS